MDYVLYVCTFLALVIICFVLHHIFYTMYKEREWRKNNQDEWIYKESTRRGFEKEKK